MILKTETFPRAFHDSLPARKYSKALHAKKKTRVEEPEVRGVKDDEGRQITFAD
jgi:hypothetical protein